MNKIQILNQQWICADEAQLLRPSAPQREVLPLPTVPPKREPRPARPAVQPLQPLSPPSREDATTEFFAQTGIALARNVDVLEHHGRVWVVQYVPRWQRDPIVPIVRGQRNGRYLRALKKFCAASIEYEQAWGQDARRYWHWWMKWRGRRLIAASKRLALTAEEKRFFERHVLKFLAVGMRQ